MTLWRRQKRQSMHIWYPWETDTPTTSTSADFGCKQSPVCVATGPPHPSPAQSRAVPSNALFAAHGQYTVPRIPQNLTSYNNTELIKANGVSCYAWYVVRPLAQSRRPSIGGVPCNPWHGTTPDTSKPPTSTSPESRVRFVWTAACNWMCTDRHIANWNLVYNNTNNYSALQFLTPSILALLSYPSPLVWKNISSLWVPAYTRYTCTCASSGIMR